MSNPCCLKAIINGSRGASVDFRKDSLRSDLHHSKSCSLKVTTLAAAGIFLLLSAGAAQVKATVTEGKGGRFVEDFVDEEAGLTYGHYASHDILSDPAATGPHGGTPGTELAHWSWVATPPTDAPGAVTTVRYFLDSGAHGTAPAMTAAQVADIHTAAGIWNASGANVALVPTTTALGADIHVHMDTTSLCPGAIGCAVIIYWNAHTPPGYGPGSGHPVPGDPGPHPHHKMARNQTLTMLSNVTWHSGPGAPPAGSSDFLTVAIHEFGHHLGLAHNGNASAGHLADEALSPMNGVLPTGTMRRTLQPTDVEAICHLYGCAPQPLTVSGLRNFDVVSPPGLDVNDFHITLHGITDPLTVPQGGTQIVGTFPAPFNNVSGAPTGWYPPTITALPLLLPTRTVVSYGGPGAQFISNQTMHFGVSLTPAGEAALDEICMNWTQDGVPVFAGGNPQIPITVVTDHYVPGETTIQIVNQDCPEDMMMAPGRWIGSVYMGILDRHAELDELVSGNPIIAASDNILVDGNTFLAGGEQLTLSDIDANSPIAAGKSIIVWYDVFEDDGGTLGRLVGTSYTAFNVAAIPEPRSACLVAFMCCIVMAARRQLMA